jgi:hypothetical protein
MNKRKAHHFWTKIRWLKPGYFLVLMLVSATVCVLALRSNNQHMVTLRDAVYAADKSGADVNKPLRELQSYVTAHMNTNLTAGNTSVYPPIQLEYTYQRLQQSQAEAVQQTNQDLYSQAQAHCESLNSSDFSGRNRVPCIEDYVESHSNIQFKPIPASLYKFDFVSPVWSPDLAGWSLLVTILSAVAFAITFGLRRWVKD